MKVGDLVKFKQHGKFSLDGDIESWIGIIKENWREDYSPEGMAWVIYWLDSGKTTWEDEINLQRIEQ